MHLKSIELYGFKSFANKMVFKFDQGITAIVGPNGSGKSNVADAVRWVLGEQSAKSLRGSKMQDVIFAGTEARKPLGYCQVDLTIDNHDQKMPIDYSEVTVSRRVYRSGEGEYFINGTSCRMRDVLELFMDTGVGQEGYSIIGQGQIDKILSNKPDERRALFDEAVGIVKFKKRKHSAEKRLEDQKQNLFRINDIITELEGQKDTLFKQAEKAKEYLSYKERLKEHEINVFILEIKQIDEEIKQLLTKKEIVDKDLRMARNASQENKNKHSEYVHRLEQLEEELESVRNSMNALSLEKEKTDGDIALIKEQIQHIASNNQRISGELERVEERINSSTLGLSNYKEEMKDVFDKETSLKNNLEEKEKTLFGINEEIVKEERHVSDIQANMIERLNEMSSIKSQMGRFQTLAENNQSRKDILLSRKDILEKSVSSLEGHIQEEKKIAKQIAITGREKVELRDGLQSSRLTISQELSEVQESRKNQIGQLQVNESRLKALTDIEDHYEGYNYSIKQVMSRKEIPGAGDGIVGVVADIIKVDKKYETAIETALGGNYQNIITKDEQTAKNMIEYLKKNRYGRATFLPMSNIHPNQRRLNEVQSMDGFIGYADELVGCETMYKDIIRFLLGRIIVASNIDAALKINKRFNNTLRIVTLEGDVVNPGGSLTGGAHKNNKNQYLSRKRHIDELKAAILTGEKALKEIDTKYQELLYQEEQLVAGLTNVGAEIVELNMNHKEQTMKIHQLDSDLTKAMMELEELVEEENSLLGQAGNLKQEIHALERSLNESEINHEHAETTVKDMMGQTVALKEQKESLEQEITHLRIEHTNALASQRHGSENIARMEEEIQGYGQQKQRLSQELEANRISSLEKESHIGDKQAKLTQIAEDLLKWQNVIATKQEERGLITKEQEKLYQLSEELGERVTLLEKEMVRLENQEMKLESSKEGFIDYMWAEYELTYNNATVYFKDGLGSIHEMKDVIGKLKNSIRRLGDVNVNAIEEYKSVIERYEFLSTQREDILEAKEKLLEMINELDLKMQTQFREQFEAINLEFQKVFKELFGGGKAFLHLSDDEDVLEAGIHINVQPPGKKLQSMMLLSGGERAFTAIALLFAIQNLKPSPFCVLDEIEAALDDANVDRFAGYLKKLTHNTQFIIITHRRGTMEASDALYGITMQEKGISTQVSVKLIEDVLEV